MCCFSFIWKAGESPSPGSPHTPTSWMQQIARNATMEHWGYLHNSRTFYTIEIRSSALCSRTLSDRRCEVRGPSPPESKLERLCGKMDPIERNHQGREPGTVPWAGCGPKWWSETRALRGAAGWASEVLSLRGGLVKEGELEWAGFNMAGLLCLVLMVLKLELALRWSWWRVLLPLWVVLWQNAVHIAVGFLWLTWMRCGREGDDLRIREHHGLD